MFSDRNDEKQLKLPSTPPANHKITRKLRPLKNYNKQRANKHPWIAAISEAAREKQQQHFFRMNFHVKLLFFFFIRNLAIKILTMLREMENYYHRHLVPHPSDFMHFYVNLTLFAWKLLTYWTLNLKFKLRWRDFSFDSEGDSWASRGFMMIHCLSFSQCSARSMESTVMEFLPLLTILSPFMTQ